MAEGRIRPQWRLVYDMLVADLSAEAGGGGRLPSEHDLARRFDVSRNTIRRALLTLSQEGRIRVVNGRGSIAAPLDVTYEIGALSRFGDTLAQLGKTPRRTVLDARVIDADAGQAAPLGLEQGTALVELISILSADDQPIVFSRRYYPRALVPDLAERYPGELSVTRIFTALGLGTLRREATTVSARMPDAAEIRHLRMPSNAPVLIAEGIGSLDGHGRVELNRSSVPAHLARFRFRSPPE